METEFEPGLKSEVGLPHWFYFQGDNNSGQDEIRHVGATKFQPP